jgi:hypothetical protein
LLISKNRSNKLTTSGLIQSSVHSSSYKSNIIKVISCIAGCGERSLLPFCFRCILQLLSHVSIPRGESFYPFLTSTPTFML